MAGVDNAIRSSVPGANIAKPLMIALGTLLASGVLFKGGSTGQSTSTGSQPTSDQGAGGLLGGLGGLLNKLQQGGLGNATNSWVGSAQNQQVSPSQLGSALGPNIVKTISQMSGLPEDELTKQLSQVLPGVVDKLTHNGRLPTVAELSESFFQSEKE
ncbi:MAG: YidB family protein [Xanthobacteraceae bacterium]